MTVFVSSIIRGFENFRQAARRAITLVHHEPIMAEDFGARPQSPQVACLEAVASSDVYLLVIGSRYSWDPSADRSATEQEYDEAVLRGKPILAFFTTEEMDDRQTGFAKKVGDFEGGVTRDTFATPDDLKDKIIAALSRLQSGMASRVISPEEAKHDFEQMLEGLTPTLADTTLAICTTPVRTDAGLTTKQMIDGTMPMRLAKELSFGQHAYFDPKSGYSEVHHEEELLIRQPPTDHSISAFALLERNASMAVGIALREDTDIRSDPSMDSFLLVDQERVRNELGRLLGFMAEMYGTIYRYRGPLYVSASLIKMELKMFGPKRRGSAHSSPMYPGESGKPVSVPSSLEAQGFPASNTDQTALANDFIERFRMRFRKEGRLRE